MGPFPWRGLWAISTRHLITSGLYDLVRFSFFLLFDSQSVMRGEEETFREDGTGGRRRGKRPREAQTARSRAAIGTSGEGEVTSLGFLGPDRADAGRTLMTPRFVSKVSWG